MTARLPILQWAQCSQGLPGAFKGFPGTARKDQKSEQHGGREGTAEPRTSDLDGRPDPNDGLV